MGLSLIQRRKIRHLSEPKDTGSEESKEINVVPFLDIITNVLMFVLATVAVTFTATIDATPAKRTGPRPPDVPTLDLTVLVVGDGFSLKARGGNVAAGCDDSGVGLAVPKREGVYDYDALRRCATKLKAAAPEFASEHTITVSANPQVPYDVVIATLDAVRTSPSGEELFPDAAFAVVR